MTSNTTELDATLAASLLRALRDLYDYENWMRFGTRLSRPTLALSDSRAELGRWRPSDRSIAISRHLVLEVPWGTVREVLCHEMAHQFVAEILGVRDEPPHGPTFTRVCHQRGIDAGATGLPAAGAARVEDAKIDRLREKVRRLLALAGSANQHEAELAMLRAREILLRHNVEEASGSPEYLVRWIGPVQRRISGARYALSGILRDHFHVEILWVDAYEPLRGETGTALEVCGTPANVEMADYVHAFLLDTADRLWRVAKPSLGGRGRQAFQRGVMTGFREKLEAQRKEWKGAGLVWVGDADLRAFYKRRHPRIRSVATGRTSQVAAHATGRAAGRDIVLHRPMGTSSSKGGGLLGKG